MRKNTGNVRYYNAAEEETHAIRIPVCRAHGYRGDCSDPRGESLGISASYPPLSGIITLYHVVDHVIYKFTAGV